jgi:hypothetical protein
MYCLEHRSRFVHNCRDCETLNETPKRDLSHLPNVKEMLAAVETRFQAAVEHAPEHWGQVIRSSTGNKASQSNTTALNPNSIFSQSMERLRLLKEDSSKSTEIQQRAERTQQMLIKRRAMGNLSIAEADRVYLVIHFVTPLSSNASSNQLFPDVDLDPLCLQYVFFSRTTKLGDALHHLKQTHFSMLSSCLHLTGIYSHQDRVSFGLYTLDSPDWRLWDRDIQLGHLCRNFEEAWVTPVVIEDILQSQRELTIPPSVAELQHLHYHQTTHQTPITSPPSSLGANSVAPTGEEHPEPGVSVSVTIAKGDKVWYHRGNNGIPLSSLSDASVNHIPVILVKVIGVHHDDFPNIYYTIAPINPPTIRENGALPEDSQKLIFQSEKQTDSIRVFPAPEFHEAAVASASASASASAQDTERQREELLQQKQALLQLLKSKATSSGLWGTDAFSISISYAGKEEIGISISPRTTVGELREYARCVIALAKLGALNPAAARSADVKLIAKGVQLKQDLQLVRDTKVGPGTKLMILG